MKEKLHRKWASAGGLLSVGVLLLAVNTLSGALFKSARIDLTENRLFTLSPGTLNIIQNLDEPVTLRFYFSEKLSVGIPGLSNYARRVRDLLEEYASKSKGKVRLIVRDPEPFSDDEDQAVQYGLQGVPVDSAGSLAYFGLVGTSSTDEQQVIPFFQQEKENSLEYQLSKLIDTLARPERKTIGLMSSLPLEGRPSNPFLPQGNEGEGWTFVRLLREEFNVRTLSPNSETIPEDIDLLMLVHPKNLGERALFAIDQFILKGKSAIVFVDPYAEADTPPPDPQNPMAALMAPRNSNLKKLFDHWGIELAEGQVAGDIETAARVNMGGGLRPQSVDYVLWLETKPPHFNAEDFTTSDLQAIHFGTSGFLRPKENAALTFTPLIQTSASAMAIDLERIQFGPNPLGLLNDYQPGGEALTLAARLDGPLKTAFPEGPPGEAGDDTKENESNADTAADATDETKGLKASQGPVHLVVVADTDLLADKFWVNVQNFFGQRLMIPRANNGVFLLNLADHLSGTGDLIGLRSRGGSARPFGRVREIQREAEQQFREREMALQAKLQETERKIAALQQQKEDTGTLMLSPEQKAEIERFRQEQIKTRKALRDVQHALRKNIEGLGARIKLINIGLMPLLVVLAAVGLKAVKKKKDRRG